MATSTSALSQPDMTESRCTHDLLRLPTRIVIFEPKDELFELKKN
jgi:hypothetical protein